MAALVLLFAHLSRIYEKQNSIAVYEKDQNKLIYEVISFISQNCRDISLETLARHFQYSKGHLSKLIKKHTGKNFSELLHDYRMNRAVYYLEHTELPVSEVLEKVGFRDFAHFNRTFRQLYGSTPTESRKNPRSKLDLGPNDR